MRLDVRFFCGGTGILRQPGPCPRAGALPIVPKAAAGVSQYVVRALRPFRQLRRQGGPADASGNMLLLRPDDGGALPSRRGEAGVLPRVLAGAPAAAGRAGGAAGLSPVWRARSLGRRHRRAAGLTACGAAVTLGLKQEEAPKGDDGDEYAGPARTASPAWPALSAARQGAAEGCEGTRSPRRKIPPEPPTESRHQAPRRPWRRVDSAGSHR